MSGLVCDARVSTSNQDLALQLDALERAGEPKPAVARTLRVGRTPLY